MIGPKPENDVVFKENSSNHDESKEYDIIVKRKISTVHDGSGNSEILPSKRFCFDDCKTTSNVNNVPTSKTLEIIVVNGTWDTSRKIPSVLAEMHTVKLNSVEESANASEIRAMKYKDSSLQEENSKGTRDCNENKETSEKDYTNNDDNKNLSWLINFKVDTLFRDVERQGFADEDGCAGNRALSPLLCSQKTQAGATASKPSKIILQKQKDQPNLEALGYQNFTDVTEKKPPFTYTELIEQALEEKGKLTVSEIYQWISQHFPFYKPNDDRWKNSVRHNLSINPSFRKGCKAPQGAGHLWTIAKRNDDSLNNLEKKQRIRAYLANKVMLDEVQLATASIEENKENRANPVDEEDSLNQVNSAVWDQPLDQTSQTISLEQSAEEILSGVKRNVEVQYLVPSHEENTSGENRVVFVKPNSFTIFPGDPPSNSDNFLFDPVLITQPTDLLNSAVRDAGLSFEADNLGAPFFITDLTPMSLNLNVGDDNTVFAEEMNFQYFQLASPV